LGVRRTQADVPGWMIPNLYQEYVRSGDAGEMPRIFYHNVQDILSLVTLAARQCDLLALALPSDLDVPGEDLYGLGRVLQELEQPDRAEVAYAEAAKTCRSPRVREMALRDLAYSLKRRERWAEALGWWRLLAEIEGAVYACEELAKYYEWHDPDLAEAMAWTRKGIGLAQAWPRGAGRREALAQLEHRLRRLERKTRTASSG
jgi:tetratricopeptide (TPR) repeat protein